MGPIAWAIDASGTLIDVDNLSLTRKTKLDWLKPQPSCE